MKKKSFVIFITMLMIISLMLCFVACGEKNEDSTSLTINNIEVNRDGDLIITYSDNSTVNLGKITGANGQNGTNGQDGINGQDGTNGQDGVNGQDGKDGVSITNTTINVDGELVITYSDGKIVNLGKVTGANGQNGTNGQDGINGQDGVNGQDGQNGKSAYEIYKDKFGYEGTEEQWINDLITGKLAYDNSNVEKIFVNNIRVAKGESAILPTHALVLYKDARQELTQVTWDTTSFDTSNVGYRILRGSIDGIHYDAKCEVRIVDYNTVDKYIDGHVQNLMKNDKAVVTISSDSHLDTVEVSDDGYFVFKNLTSGTYTIKVDAPEYNVMDSLTISIGDVTADETTIYDNIGHANFSLCPIVGAGYQFQWVRNDIDDTSCSSTVVEHISCDAMPLNDIDVADIGYASHLRDQYNIVLNNDDMIWSNEVINRFYELYTTLPNSVVSDIKSVWTLTREHINNDIEYTLDTNGVYQVRLSIDAVKNATPRVVTIDGEKGSYYSKRLYHAIVRFVTNGGNDGVKCDAIMTTNFMTSFYVPNYTTLTAGITDEGPEAFQEFLPEEKLLVLAMFEEMPVGMHKMKELKYVIRRRQGHPHPLYPNAGAVTWPYANEPYIEFMEGGLTNAAGYDHAKRLIIHEKTHMLWAHYFSDALKEEWCKVGGWYRNPDDKDGWSTTKTTEFVSAYAHGINPDEDMAESVATYVTNPDLLKSRSINKYNFIRQYIMKGDYYKMAIRDDMTFEVYNLNPDYMYPGMIEKINVNVEGGPYEDKRLTFDIYLRGGEGAGASSFYFRFVPYNGSYRQFVDVQGSAVNEEGTHLRGTAFLSKYCKGGYWYTDQITLKDEVGNERYESNTDFTMKVFVDSPKEDVIDPQYVEGSIDLSVAPVVDDTYGDLQVLTVKGAFIENIGIDSIWVRLVEQDTNKSSRDYYVQEIDEVNGTFEGKIYIPNNWSTGTYYISVIGINDLAGNMHWKDLYPEDTVNKCTINITTPNPDNEAPVLDENNIGLESRPTKPQAPDGETIVTLKLPIKDNISGFKIAFVRIVDPEGKQHGYWLYPPYNWRALYFNYEGHKPTDKITYTFSVTLPKGSAPGTWGVMEISLTDFAGNVRVYDFTEIMHFDIIN